MRLGVDRPRTRRTRGSFSDGRTRGTWCLMSWKDTRHLVRPSGTRRCRWHLRPALWQTSMRRRCRAVRLRLVQKLALPVRHTCLQTFLGETPASSCTPRGSLVPAFQERSLVLCIISLGSWEACYEHGVYCTFKILRYKSSPQLWCGSGSIWYGRPMTCACSFAPRRR